MAPIPISTRCPPPVANKVSPFNHAKEKPSKQPFNFVCKCNLYIPDCLSATMRIGDPTCHGIIQYCDVFPTFDNLIQHHAMRKEAGAYCTKTSKTFGPCLVVQQEPIQVQHELPPVQLQNRCRVLQLATHPQWIHLSRSDSPPSFVSSKA